MKIVERHHNQKIDAPSGTALAIADAIDETLLIRLNMSMTDTQFAERESLPK